MNHNLLNKSYIKKDDFKRFKVCPKIMLAFYNNKYKKNTINLLTNKKISFLNKKLKSELQFHSKLDDLISLKTPNVKRYRGESIEDGMAIGALAKQYFINKKMHYKDLSLNNINDSLRLTKEYMEDPTIDVLFEPTFLYNNAITRCDVLKRTYKGWEIIEVKAKTTKNISKSANEYLNDITYQFYVLKNNYIKIKNLKLMIINSDFRFDDKEIALGEFFAFINVLKKHNLYEYAINYSNKNMDKDIETIQKLINIDFKNFENFFKSKKCAGEEYCKQVIAYIDPKNTIFNLTNLFVKKKVKYFYDDGIYMLTDLNEDDIELNPSQKRQVEVIKDSSKEIDIKFYVKLLHILSEYKYPIYMYDFETMKSAIPKFVHTKTYQQIPFQYSLHILLNPNFNYKNNQNIKHHYFLSSGETDPRVEFINHFILDFCNNDNPVYVSYNKSFEIMIIKELINYVDYDLNNKRNIFKNHLKIIAKLKFVMNNTIDLMDFFHNFLIYKVDFNGSKSIKATLPSFDADFDYSNLNIQKGDMASELFRRRVENNIKIKDWYHNYSNDMIKYCNQDTLGMVVLFSKILELINNHQEH